MTNQNQAINLKWSVQSVTNFMLIQAKIQIHI